MVLGIAVAQCSLEELYIANLNISLEAANFEFQSLARVLTNVEPIDQLE